MPLRMYTHARLLWRYVVRTQWYSNILGRGDDMSGFNCTSDEEKSGYMEGFKRYLKNLGLSDKSIRDDMSRINTMKSRGIDFRGAEESVRKGLDKSSLSPSTIKSCERLCKRFREYKSHTSIEQEDNVQPPSFPNSASPQDSIEVKKPNLLVHHYPEYVDLSSIKTTISADKKYRYDLHIGLKNRYDKHLLVILKNPSDATAEHSDHTANQIIKYAFQNNYGNVSILNLFAYRSKDSKVIIKLLYNDNVSEAIGPDNNMYIKKAAAIADDIIVAWGVPPAKVRERYDARVEEVLYYLSPYQLQYIKRLSQGEYPLHAQVWPNKTASKDYRKNVIPSWKVILYLGAMGGNIRIFGKRSSDGSWIFHTTSNELTLVCDLVKDDTLNGLAYQVTGAVEGWDNALKLLPRRWQNLYPKYVHPEFRERILKLVKQMDCRGMVHWYRVCEDL